MVLNGWEIGKFWLVVDQCQEGFFWDVYLKETMEMVESSRWIPTDGSDETYYTSWEKSIECGKSMCEYMEVHGHPLEPLKK